MMDTWLIGILAATVGYLIGSFSFARLVFAWLRPGVPIEPVKTPTKDGSAALVSHAVGATSVMMTFGPRWGMLTTLVDILKSFVPTLIFHLIYPNDSYHLICAVAVLVGHLWPVWYSFNGGGGNANIMGMLLAVSPLGLLVTHSVGMVIGMAVPVISFLAGVVLMIPWFAWRNGIYSAETLFAIIVTLLYVGGQVPEYLQARRLHLGVHDLDVDHVMRTMKRSAATGKPGRQVMNTLPLNNDDESRPRTDSE